MVKENLLVSELQYQIYFRSFRVLLAGDKPHPENLDILHSWEQLVAKRAVLIHPGKSAQISHPFTTSFSALFMRPKC